MHFLRKLPSTLAILLFLCFSKIIFADDIQIHDPQIIENSDANELSQSIPIKYEFTTAETSRFLFFFLVNLRPWKQQIPQQLIEFMDGKLTKMTTNLGETTEIKKDEEENEEEKEGKETFKFVGLMRNLFKLLNLTNKSGNEKKQQKNLEKIESRREQERNLKDELEGIGNILEENGELLVQQFSAPLNDLLASLVGQQPIGDIFANFETEIEIGSKKGFYSEKAASALRQILTLLKQRMKERFIPHGTLQAYYAHTMLYEYFLHLFTNFLEESKIKLGLFGNHSILQLPIKDKFMENLFEEKPWEIVENPQKLATLPLNFEACHKQIQHKLNSEKEDSEKMKELLKIGKENGVKMVDKENLKIVREICVTLSQILIKFKKSNTIFKLAIQKLSTEFNDFPNRFENYERTEEKNKEEMERVKIGAHNKSKIATNEEAPGIEQEWTNLLRQIELMFAMLPKFVEIMNSPNEKTLKKLDRISRIGIELIEIGISKKNKILALMIASAYVNVLEGHLETLELNYERKRVKNVLEKVKQLEEGILSEKWYSKWGNDGNNGNNLNWVETVKSMRELAKWFHQSEQFRYLIEQENGLKNELEIMEKAISGMNECNNEMETKREAAIDNKLAQIEEELAKFIELNLDKKKINIIKLILDEIKIYKKQKEELMKEKDEILKNREKWQSKWMEAKKTPELKMVEEAEIELKSYEAKRQQLSNKYIQIMQKLEGITTANNSKMQKIKNNEELSRMEKLLQIKRILENTKTSNKISLSLQKPFLNEQNKLIKALIERIEEQINAEENWQIQKEKKEILHKNMLEKLNEKSQKVDKQVWGVKNHFMLQTLFGNEHYERMDEFNGKMEKLTENYGKIIWAIRELSEELKAKIEMIGILREREEQKWIEKDEDGTEMRYSLVLNGVKENEKEQRQILREFFDNDVIDLTNLSKIKPVVSADEAEILARKLSLAESAIFIDWISEVNFDLDLINNPTGIIDILADKLKEILAKFEENPFIQKNVENDLLTDFAKNPIEYEDPKEFYNRSIGISQKEIKAKIALRKVQLLRKPLESAILMLIGMQKKFDELSHHLAIPEEIEHQILSVKKPIKLIIPLNANQAASKGKFLLYSLYTFGECMVQEFKSNEKTVNRMLKLGIKMIREDQLMKSRIATNPLEFRSVEFERKFNENFVENIFAKFAFDEIDQQHEEENGKEEGPIIKEGSIRHKLWKETIEETEMEFKKNLRKGMCQFSSIQGDEQNEENIQLLEETIKNIYYRPEIVKTGPPLSPIFGGYSNRKKAKFSKIAFNPIRFLNDGSPLTNKSRLSKSIWRDYPEKDPVDNDFKEHIRKYLIGMYRKTKTSKIIDQFAKAYIVFPYQTKREGLQVALLLKELLKLNNKKLSPIAEKKEEKLMDEKPQKDAIINAENTKAKLIEEPKQYNDANDGQNEAAILEKVKNEKHEKIFEKNSKVVLKRKKREISQQNKKNREKNKIRINEFFDKYSTEDNSDEYKIPLKALPIYRLVKSLMMDKFNWQNDENVKKIMPMIKESGFPGLAELNLYMDLDFNKLTDELDQFCFIVAHSKRNVHMQIKVLYYRWKALKTISDNNLHLKSFNTIVKILKANESPLKMLLYRLVDYANYINQYTNGFRHVFGFTLKSLTEFLNRKMKMHGDSEFRIADLIVEDFVTENKLEELNKLMKMMKDIEEKMAGAKFVSLLEIRSSMQDILQMRLNLLTEINSKTKDSNETIELAQNGNGQTPKKDWHLDKEESEKHIALLKNVYSEKFHNLISRLNDFCHHEEQLRDYYCYDSCQGSMEWNTKFDFTKVVFELQRALGIVKSAITKYQQKIRLKEEKKKRQTEQNANKIKMKKETGNVVDYEKIKKELEEKRTEFLERQKQKAAYDKNGNLIKMHDNHKGEKMVA